MQSLLVFMAFNGRRQFGFSLIEAMLATGILGVGLVLIAMVFPVGIKLTSVATERAIGAVAADEAFAKIQMWGFPPVWPAMPDSENSVDYLRLLNIHYGATSTAWPEFFYSSANVRGELRNYHWSALCRRLPDDPHRVQVTVFVTRKVAPNITFRKTHNIGADARLQPWPSPVSVTLRYEGNPTELKIWTMTWGEEYDFFSSGTALVDDRTGKLYYLQETRDSTGDGFRDTLVLRDGWQWPGYDLNPNTPPVTAQNVRFWVVPPGIGSPRNPVVAVRQKVMRLE